MLFDNTPLKELLDILTCINGYIWPRVGHFDIRGYFSHGITIKTSLLANESEVCVYQSKAFISQHSQSSAISPIPFQKKKMEVRGQELFCHCVTA